MTSVPPAPMHSRGDWLAGLLAISGPVLTHGAARTLKARMPVEVPIGDDTRRAFAHLEACGRTLAGIAPWLELAGLDGREAELQRAARRQAQELLASITDPVSPDHLNFSDGRQPLVDAAFLAQAILRAPTILWRELPANVRGNIIRALSAARQIEPPPNNWILFSAMIETFLLAVEAGGEHPRIARTIRQMDEWYVGDGWYGDGPDFCFDYYNSFVIHPFLLDMMRVLGPQPDWADFAPRHIFRAQRHAVQIERMIAPDGSMPAIGRSLTYRCGNLHLLAQLALLQCLPAGLPAPQVRAALSRAVARSLSAAGTFDAEGWLTVGHGGHQPALAEEYISTGSLYMCTAAFLPLGLSPDDDFWTGPDGLVTSERIYGGGEVSPDRPVR